MYMYVYLTPILYLFIKESIYSTYLSIEYAYIAYIYIYVLSVLVCLSNYLPMHPQIYLTISSSHSSSYKPTHNCPLTYPLHSSVTNIPIRLTPTINMFVCFGTATILRPTTCPKIFVLQELQLNDLNSTT
jgi:hypothetical protein